MVAVLAGCSEDYNRFIPESIEPVGDINRLFSDLDIESTYYQFDAADGLATATESQNILIIPPSAFMDYNGDPVQGTLLLEYKELDSKGDLIRMNRPSVTMEHVLEYASNQFIEVSKGNEALLLQAGKTMEMRVPVEDATEKAELFIGQQSGNNFFWFEADEDPQLWDNVTIDNWDWEQDGENWTDNGYVFESANIGWNSAAVYSTADDLIELCVNVSEEFNYRNTVVFAVYANKNTVVRLFGSEESSFCSDQYGGLPSAEELIIVAIAEKGHGSYFLGSSSISLMSDQSMTLDLTEITRAQLFEYLDTL